MIGAALDTFVPWRMRRVRFDDQAGSDSRATTGAVVETFLAGARGSFAGADAWALCEREDTVPWHARAFFWEGQAFGASARHVIGRRAGNPMSAFHAPGYRFMFYTGLGFWNGVARRHWMPRVSLDADRWSEVQDWAAGRTLVAGGESFGVVTLRGRLDRATIDALDVPGDRWWRHGLLQGAGRAAWFLYMRDSARLATVLYDAGAEATAIAEGLGIAITFTQLGEPHRIVAQIEALPERFGRSLRAGSRAALGIAVADDPRITDRVLALPDPLPRWFHQGAGALEHAGRGPDMAPRLSAALHDLD